jgi:hypothetical protein
MFLMDAVSEMLCLQSARLPHAHADIGTKHKNGLKQVIKDLWENRLADDMRSPHRPTAMEVKSATKRRSEVTI